MKTTEQTTTGAICVSELTYNPNQVVSAELAVRHFRQALTEDMMKQAVIEGLVEFTTVTSTVTGLRMMEARMAMMHPDDYKDMKHRIETLEAENARLRNRGER